MKLVSTLVSSSLAILVMLFAMGKLPQVDVFWDSVNHGVQAHNDEAIRTLYRLLPTFLFVAGAGGLFMLLKPDSRRKNKSA